MYVRAKVTSVLCSGCAYVSGNLRKRVTIKPCDEHRLSQKVLYIRNTEIDGYQTYIWPVTVTTFQ
jgi:hypothetical protein